MNPYTYLRTLLNDEGKHDKLNWLLSLVLKNKEYDVVAAVMPPTAGFIGTSYTTSLDALIPLWPENWSWVLMHGGYCCCNNKARVGEENIGICSIRKPTPSLAMLDALLQVLEYEHDRKETK